MISIDQFSLSAVPIDQLFDQTNLGSATGFIWCTADRYFLVTNWHVVTCRVFPTKEYIKSHAGRPNTLRVRFNFGTKIFVKQPYDIRIRDSDDQPLWLVHPARNIDIAVVPIPFSREQLSVVNLCPINAITTSDLAVCIGMDVFVLGYPLGAGPPGYPVWKRGSIASEPDLVRLTTDYLLVDTASRPGMSGGPVILRSWGHHILANGAVSTEPKFLTKFIGVYSGRLTTKNPVDVQLGLVWPAEFIDEIIAGDKRDID